MQILHLIIPEAFACNFICGIAGWASAHEHCPESTYIDVQITCQICIRQCGKFTGWMDPLFVRDGNFHHFCSPASPLTQTQF